MGQLSIMQIRDFYLHHFVSLVRGQVPQRGGAEFLDDGVGTVEPGFADTEQLSTRR